MGNPNPDRQFYDHASGTEVTASNGVFDVPAWRQDTTQDLIDIKDEINDEALANRNNETAEHTSTRTQINAVTTAITTEGNETQAKLDTLEASLTALENTLVSEQTDTQTAIAAVQTEINDESATTRAIISAESNETQTAINAVQTEINDEALAGRNNETTEHTSTRLTITTKSDEEQVKLDSIETRLNAPVAVPPNKSATATTTDYALDSTTALKIKDASTTFIHCSISNDNTVGVWLKLQAATVDNVKTGIFIDRGDYWEMPEGALYTGEISAIAESGTPTINVTVY